MRLQAQKGWRGVTPNGPKTLSDVTQSWRYAVFICGEISLRYTTNSV